MTKKLQVYKCQVCGNIIEVLHTGVGELVCCNQKMSLIDEKTTDQGQEKHLPVVEKQDKKIKVKVGEIPHPMEEAHYIEWIEVITGDGVYRKQLNPGDNPEAEFDIRGEVISVREYCNLHGLWIKE